MNFPKLMYNRKYALYDDFYDFHEKSRVLLKN